MAVLENIPANTNARLSQIGNASLVVALPFCSNAELLASAASILGPALQKLEPQGQSVLLYPESAHSGSPPAAAGLHLLPYPLPAVAPYDDNSLDLALRSLFRAGQSLETKAFLLVGADLSPVTFGDVPDLAAPILQNAYDLSVPLYARRPLSGLLNSGILYPLHRAVYGVRVRYPMATSVAVSARLANHYLQSPAPPNHAGWLTTRAILAGMQLCQVHRPEAPNPSGPEAEDLSSTLTRVLGAQFSELERNAAFWQKIRTSQPVRTFGQPFSAPQEQAPAAVQSLVEQYQRGCKDLIDIWAAILSPAPLVELRKIARLPLAAFQISDELWAHILYDFVLGHRQRVINRDHLLRALTPLYLGWVASYALQLQRSPEEPPETRLEAACVALETLKPYLLSRWRWPDRFNP